MAIRILRILALLGSAVWLLVLFQGCAGAPPPIPRRVDFSSCEPLGYDDGPLGLYLGYQDAGLPDGESVAFGAPCVKHADCLGGFCDRGACAGFPPVVCNRYGYPCRWVKPYGVPTELSDNPFACLGYLCLDQTCQSCQSDAECHHWLGPETMCRQFGGFPGKQCGPASLSEVCPNGNLAPPQEWYCSGVEPHPPPDFDHGTKRPKD